MTTLTTTTTIVAHSISARLPLTPSSCSRSAVSARRSLALCGRTTTARRVPTPVLCGRWLLPPALCGRTSAVPAPWGRCIAALCGLAAAAALWDCSLAAATGLADTVGVADDGLDACCRRCCCCCGDGCCCGCHLPFDGDGCRILGCCGCGCGVGAAAGFEERCALTGSTMSGEARGQPCALTAQPTRGDRRAVCRGFAAAPMLAG
eukprot:scaffold44778_cov36-Phaeocystis_antarctica.AAC.2